MARDPTRAFKDLRTSLYRDLVSYSCVPQVDVEGTFKPQPDKRFFPRGTAKKVLTSDVLGQLFALVTLNVPPRVSISRASQLARQVEARKLHVFIAILITSQCDLDAYSAFTARLVAPEIWTDADHRLATLPAEHSRRLREMLGDDLLADNFLDKQYEFFAPVIEKYGEIRGQFRRLPYIREKLIGQGSFGRIYEVVVCDSVTFACRDVCLSLFISLFSIMLNAHLTQIAPHHFRGEDSMSNSSGKVLARKDIELTAEEKAYEKERDVLREIVGNARKNENILESMGSLKNGSIYSLFMPLAKFDLKQFMERYKAPPQTLIQKAKLVKCAVGLADAIKYLHEELETPGYERLSCFHMDLKPQNILVFIDPKTGDQQWKLSDFNMSRVKMKRKETVEQLTLGRTTTLYDNVYEINKLFKRRIPDTSNASVTDYTIGRRGTGTYLSPESCIEGHPVHAESDTWSLACVISVVFSYLYGGHAAVTEYSELRGRNDIDSFFSYPEGTKSRKLSEARINDGVKKWHKHLRMRTKQKMPDESPIFEAMIRFLDDKVLIIDPKKRSKTAAKDVREELIKAWREFNALAKRPPTSVQPLKRRFKIPIIKDWSLRGHSETDALYLNWEIPLPTVRACAFGPDAKPLVCVMDNVLKAYSLEHVLISSNTNDFEYNLIDYGEGKPENRTRHWIPYVGASSRYILAATNHNEFDVSVRVKSL